MSQNTEHGTSTYRWAILSMCALTYLLHMLARVAWPPLVPVIAPVLNINMAEAGAYMTAFFTGYIVTQVPSGLLGDRFGVRTLLTVAILVQGLVTFFFGDITTFAGGLVLRLFSGLAAGCVYASCFKLIVQWFGPKQRGLAFGLYMTGSSISMALANFIIPNINALWGWQVVFRIIGAFIVVCSPVVFFLVKGEAPGAPAPGGPRPGLLVGLKTVLKDRNILIMCLGGIAYLAVGNGFMTWANTYMTNVIMMDLILAGYVMTTRAVAGMIISPLIGHLAGKTGLGRAFMMGAMAFMAVTIIMFGRVSSVSAVWILAVLVGVGIAVASPMLSFVVSSYTPQKFASTTGGVTSFCWQFGSLLAPLVTGWSVDVTGSFNAVWYMLSALCVVGFVLLLFVRKPAPE